MAKNKKGGNGKTIEIMLQIANALEASRKVAKNFEEQISEAASKGLFNAVKNPLTSTAINTLITNLKVKMPQIATQFDALMTNLNQKLLGVTDEQTAEFFTKFNNNLVSSGLTLENAMAEAMKNASESADFDDFRSKTIKAMQDSGAALAAITANFPGNKKMAKLLTEEYNKQYQDFKNIKDASKAINNDITVASKLAKETGTTQEKALKTYLSIKNTVDDIEDATRKTKNELRNTTNVELKDAFKSWGNMFSYIKQNYGKATILAVWVLAKEIISQVVDKSMDVAILWGQTSKQALDMAGNIMSMSSNSRIANEQIMGVVSSMNKYVKTTNLGDESTRNMVEDLAKFSKITGLSADEVGDFGATAITQFKMSTEEVSKLTKTMSSFTGMTQKDLQGIIKSMKSYQEILVKVYGTKGIQMFKDGSSAAAESFKMLTQLAKDSGVDVDKFNETILELANPKNAAKFQMLFGSFKEAEGFSKSLMDSKTSMQSFWGMIDKAASRFGQSNLADPMQAMYVAEALEKQMGISKNVVMQMIKQRQIGIEQYGSLEKYNEVLKERQTAEDRYLLLTQKFSESWKLIKEMVANLVGRSLLPAINLLMKGVSWLLQIKWLVEGLGILVALYYSGMIIKTAYLFALETTRWIWRMASEVAYWTFVTAAIAAFIVFLGIQFFWLGLCIVASWAISTPWIWIPLLIIGVIAVIVLLWKKCDWFRKSVLMIWEIFKKWWPALLGPVGLIIALWKNCEKFRNSIKSIGSTLKVIGTMILDYLLSPFTRIYNVFMNIVGAVKALFNGDWRGFANKIKAAMIAMMPEWMKNALKWFGLDLNSPEAKAAADKDVAIVSKTGPKLEGKATGDDYIPETKPYLLHKGEAVINAKDNASLRERLDKLISLLEQYLPNISSNTQKGGSFEMFTNFNSSTGIL